MLTRDLFDTVPARALARRPRPPREGLPTLEELEAARQSAARVVLLFGDAYLPIFERLDRECARARDREDVIARVRRIAAGR